MLRNVFTKLLVSTTLCLPVAAQAAEKLQGVTDKEIKVGAVTILSGPFAFYGAINQSIKAYFDMVNAQGGVHGRKITYILGDSGNSTPKAVELVNRMINQDKVMGFVFNLGELNKTTYKIIARKKIFDFYMGDMMGDYKDHPTLFFQQPSWTLEANATSDYIKKNLAGKKVGVIYVNAAHGKETLTALKKSLGSSIVKAESIEYDAVNGDAQVLSMMKAGAEVVVVHIEPPASSALIKFAHLKSFKPKWIVNTYNTNEEFVQLATKEAAEGTISHTYIKKMGDATDPATKRHMEMLKKHGNGLEPMDGLTNAGDAIAQTFVEVLQRAGRDLTRESLIKAAESFKDYTCDFCAVPANTSPTNHRLMSTSKMVIVKDGKWVPLESKAPATVSSK